MWGSKKSQKKIYSGFYGDCSPQQMEALQKFRALVIKLNNNQINQKWDDYYLLRFLRARKFVIEDVQKMWKNFIEWRTANDVDNAIYFKFPQLIKIRKQYPHGYHKVDKKFRPIYIQRVGLLNVDQVFKITSPERLLKYYAMTYQTLINTIFPGCTLHYQKVTGQTGRIEQTFTILDLKDVKLSQTSIQFCQASILTQPKQLSINSRKVFLKKFSMFIINAPFLFTGIWMVVKMWIDDKTKQKIKILGSNYKKQLLEYVDPQNLPTFIDGGKCTCGQADCLYRNVGPWNPQGLQIYPYSVGIKNRQQELKSEVQLKIKEEKLLLETKQKEQLNEVYKIKKNDQVKKQIVSSQNIAQNQIASIKLTKNQVKQNENSQKIDKQVAILQKNVIDIQIGNVGEVSDQMFQNKQQISEKEISLQGTIGKLEINGYQKKPQS